MPIIYRWVCRAPRSRFDGTLNVIASIEPRAVGFRNGSQEFSRRRSSATMAVLQVVITGGAGQIAYSLIPLIARGLVFGPGVQVSLRLLDIPPSAQALEGEFAWAQVVRSLGMSSTLTLSSGTETARAGRET